MKLPFASLSGWRSGASQAFTRFPWNILCALVGAACCIVALHTDKNEWLVGHCIRLAMAAGLGMPLFFSLRMLWERMAHLTRWPIDSLMSRQDAAGAGLDSCQFYLLEK